MQDHKVIKLNFTKILQFDAALLILQKLQASGYQALFAGGSVRDILNHRSDIENIDIDIATSALPDEVEALFSQTVAVGKAFGVIRVIVKGHSLEVATFRQDGPYQDGRRPETVNFSGLKEDAKRRDFTVNALFYDPISETLFDHVNGFEDLKNKKLKAVGDATLRFQEDELRRLRLIRFVSQLGFDIEPQTFEALKKNIQGIKKVSLERITDEICKMWKGKDLKKAFSLFWSSGMAEVLNPGLVKPHLDESQMDLISRKNQLEQWLHYFFVMYGFQDTKKHLAQFKLSSETQKHVLKASQYFLKVADFMSLNKSQQRIDLQDPVKAWILQVHYGIMQKNSLWPELKQKLLAMGPLPLPLLDGHDVKDRFQGADRGRVLDELYLLQLDEGWTSREQALTGLAKFKS